MRSGDLELKLRLAADDTAPLVLKRPLALPPAQRPTLPTPMRSPTRWSAWCLPRFSSDGSSA
jgi:hypothetical protein